MACTQPFWLKLFFYFTCPLRACHVGRVELLSRLELLMPMAFKGGARCCAEVVVMHVVAFFIAGMVDIFVAAIPRCLLATHLPRWRPRPADCVRGSLALACACGLSGAACLIVLVFAEVIEFWLLRHGPAGGVDACGNEAWCWCLRRLCGGPLRAAE